MLVRVAYLVLMIVFVICLIWPSNSRDNVACFFCMMFLLLRYIYLVFSHYYLNYALCDHTVREWAVMWFVVSIHSIVWSFQLSLQLSYSKAILMIFFVMLYCRGQRIKTRKRNIAAPLDPASFSDAIVQIYLDNAGDLVSPVKHPWHVT